MGPADEAPDRDTCPERTLVSELDRPGEARIIEQIVHVAGSEPVPSRPWSGLACQPLADCPNRPAFPRPGSFERCAGPRRAHFRYECVCPAVPSRRRATSPFFLRGAVKCADRTARIARGGRSPENDTVSAIEESPPPMGASTAAANQIRLERQRINERCGAARSNPLPSGPRHFRVGRPCEWWRPADGAQVARHNSMQPGTRPSPLPEIEYVHEMPRPRCRRVLAP